jgi:hypothetical protein
VIEQWVVEAFCLTPVIACLFFVASVVYVVFSCGYQALYDFTGRTSVLCSYRLYFVCTMAKASQSLYINTLNKPLPDSVA